MVRPGATAKAQRILRAEERQQKRNCSPFVGLHCDGVEHRRHVKCCHCGRLVFRNEGGAR